MDSEVSERDIVRRTNCEQVPRDIGGGWEKILDRDRGTSDGWKSRSCVCASGTEARASTVGTNYEEHNSTGVVQGISRNKRRIMGWRILGRRIFCAVGGRGSFRKSDQEIHPGTRERDGASKIRTDEIILRGGERLTAETPQLAAVG